MKPKELKNTMRGISLGNRSLQVGHNHTRLKKAQMNFNMNNNE